MVIDPYKVLGVSQDASPEEIKKAYRKKAKECHPDLHPDDPNAKQKMQEVNEAYDILMNPGKYQSRQSGPQQGNPYGQGGYYQQQGSSYGYGGSYGQGSWSPFDDLFGAGGYSSQVPPPHEEASDSDAIRQVVRNINSGQYQAALYILNGVPDSNRSARWYYLSALANLGIGSRMAALAHMRTAAQMEPGNALYRQLLDQFQQAGETYRQNGRGFNMHVFYPGKLCLGLCLARFCCPYLWCCC